MIALLVSQGGAGARVWLAVPILAAGVFAGLAPFRYGLAVAVVLAGFGGFMLDFVKDGASYWNEIFAVLVIARSVVSKRPSARELVGAAALAGVFGAYLATGTSLKADAWGLKVLLLSAVVGWAVARLGVGRAEWRAVYAGLVVIVPANLVLEIWQRAKGVAGLAGLGLVYGDRVREIASGGALRSFGGFTSAAPLSYALAISLAAWVGFALGGRGERRVAIATVWIVPVALAGIYLTIDRTAVLALLAAFAVVGITYRPAIILPAAFLAAVAIATATALHTGTPFRHQIGSAVKARSSLWAEYLADFRPFGRGPATAGSAYGKVKPKGWVVPIRAPNNWYVSYDRVSMGSPALAVVAAPSGRARIRISALATGKRVPRRLFVTTGAPAPEGRKLLERTIPVRRSVRVAWSMPRLAHESGVWLTAVPAPRLRRTLAARSPHYRDVVVNLVTNPSFEAGTGGWRTDWPNYWLAAKGGKLQRESSGGWSGGGFATVEATPERPYSGIAIGLGRLPRGGYVGSLYVRGSGGPIQLALGENGSKASYVFSGLTDTWTRVATPPWRATGNRAYLVVRTAGPSRLHLQADAAQVERGTSPSTYCDGESDNCRWEGVANASLSLRGGSTALTTDIGSPASRRATESIHVLSAWLPMPQAVPFTVAVGSEEMEVVRIVDLTTYLVRRGVNGTRPTSHAAGAVVTALVERLFPVLAPPFLTGKAAPRVSFAVEGRETPVLTLEKLRVDGTPSPRTPAERIWQRWFERTPAALQSDGPGLVDNLYVSWLWQYGLLGVLICVAWLAALLWPLFRPKRGPALITAALVGVFFVVAACVVNVWEEAPSDLLAALVLAHVFGWSDQPRRPSARGRAGSRSSGILSNDVRVDPGG